VAVSFLLKSQCSGIFCRLVFTYYCFGESFCHHLQVSPRRVKSVLCLVFLDYHEEGGSQLLWNMVPYSSRLDSSPAPLWEPEIFCFSLSMSKFHIHVVVWEMPLLNKISSLSLSLLVTVRNVWLWSHTFLNGDILYHSTTKQNTDSISHQAQDVGVFVFIIFNTVVLLTLCDCVSTGNI